MTDSLPAQPVKPFAKRRLCRIVPNNESERLAALYRYQILDTPAEVAFDRITTLAARLFKKPTVLISLVDESRAWFKSSIGFGAAEVPRNDALCNVAVLTDEPLIVPDTRLDDRFTCNPFVQCEPSMRFYAGAPLLDRDGFNLGTLCLLDTVPHHPLTAEEEATLVDLAAMVVSELELRLAAQQIASVDAALVEITQGVSKVTGGAFFDELVRHFATELDRQQSELMLVEQTKLLELVATGQPLDECLSALCSSIAKLSSHTRACVLLTDTLRTKFPRSIAPDFPPSLSEGLKDTPINELAIGTCGTAVYCGEPVTCSDIASDESWSQSWRDVCIAHGIRACYSAPIMGIDNLPVGSVMLCFSEARLPTDWEYRLSEFGTKIASITIDRKRSIEDLRESEERLHLALTAADMATWDADLSTGKTIWSAQHFQILGYDPATVDAPTIEMWLSCVHPSDRAAVMQARATAQQERSIYRIEYRIVRADTGAVVWVATTGRFLNNQAGEAMRLVGVMFDITDRKVAELKIEQLNCDLAAQTDELQTILDTLPVGVAIAEDPQCSVIWSNTFGQNMLKVSPDTNVSATGAEAETLPFRHYRDGREIPGDQLPMQLATAQAQAIQNVEIQMLRADGVTLDWLVTAVPLFDVGVASPLENHQAVRGCVATFTDVTELKRLQSQLQLREANLAQSNARFESAMLALRGTVYEWNLQTKIIYRSKGLFELLGFRPEDVPPINEWWTERVHPDDLERTQAEFRAAPAGIDRFESEYRVRHAAGNWVWVSDRSYFQYDAQGEMLNVIGFSTDITERKLTEAELARTNEILTATINGTSDVIFVKDLQGKYVTANSAAAEWVNTSVADMLGRDDRSLFPPDIARHVISMDRQVIETGESIVYEEEIPDRGTLRSLLTAKYPWRDPQGTIVGVIGISRDITDRKRAEAALAERNQELNSFAYTVSHDLKAPLRAISNLSVWIEEDLEDKLSPDTEQQFALLRTRVKRMESMIDSLLLYARAGRQRATVETFDLAELLSEIIDSLAPPESFRIDIQLPLPTLTTKRIFLSQVFANLISNAIKHHNSVTGHLQIWAIDHSNCHEFIIKDDGPGIAIEDHVKIFEIFQTLTDRDNSDSTGIGLAIVKKIIETEQGTIRLESSLGQGTTFYVTWAKSHG